MRPLWSLIALALVLIAGGCARQPVQPVDNWQAHRLQAEALEHWQISGKLGARLPDDGGSARLRWRQSERDYRIDLSGPFGQGRLVIETTETGVRLRQGGEQPLEAHSAQALLYRATGWQLPVKPLAWWVRGIPAPDSRHEVVERTEEGLLKTLKQDGWTLFFADYQSQTPVPLPGRVVAERDDIRLTLVIYDWSIPDS